MSFLPRILTKNWQLKILAGGMAVLLWTVPRFEGQSSQILEDVPVRVDLTDPRWALVGDASPALVSVTLSGPARDLFALGIDRPPVLIPIGEVVSSDTTVILLPSWFRFSGRDGVVVEDLSPEAVTLNFEAIQDRDIPFSVPLSGDLPQGLSRAGPPEITPSGAQVSGAASRFEGLDSLHLMPLDLSLVGGGSGPFALGVDTTGLQGLTVVLREASVVIPTDSTRFREFVDLPVLLPALDSDPQLQAQPASVTVVLRGPRNLVDLVDPETLTVTVPTGRPGLAPGQEATVFVEVDGFPEFVETTTQIRVLLRRPAGQ